jgi:hypothetical protein
LDEKVGTCIMMYCRPENVAIRRLFIDTSALDIPDLAIQVRASSLGELLEDAAI